MGFITGTGGDDSLPGTSGNDTVELSLLAVGVTITPLGGSTSVTGSGGIAITGSDICCLVATEQADIIDVPNQLVCEVEGRGGHDSPCGSVGIAPYNGGNIPGGAAGNDTVFGTLGDDVIHASIGIDQNDAALQAPRPPQALGDTQARLFDKPLRR